MRGNYVYISDKKTLSISNTKKLLKCAGTTFISVIRKLFLYFKYKKVIRKRNFYEWNKTHSTENDKVY